MLANCKKMYASQILISMNKYRNDHKFSDRYAWANSVDPDQTAVRSRSTLFAMILSALFGLVLYGRATSFKF